MPDVEYEAAAPRGPRSGVVLLALAAISAIACVALLYGADRDLYRLAAGALCALATWFFAKRGRRRRIPVLRSIDALSLLVGRTGIPLVLYLRRFAEDESRDHPQRTEGDAGGTDEEQLAASFSDVCLFVAIGRPGEPLPPWGAYRLYVTRDDWRTQVATLITLASAIVVRCGRSDALRWELDRIRQAGKLTRTLLLLPGKRSPEDLRLALPEDPPFDIPMPSGEDSHYPAFVTFGGDGVARVHDRDLTLRYGDAARQVAVHAWGLQEMAGSARQVVRGFYGRTERTLSTVLSVSILGCFYGWLGAMISVASLVIPVLLTDGRTEDALMDRLVPVVWPIMAASVTVVIASIGVTILTLVLGQQLVPRR